MTPKWTKALDKYHGEDNHCKVCGKPILVGEEFWYDSASMIREPPLVFHERCRRIR